MLESTDMLVAQKDAEINALRQPPADPVADPAPAADPVEEF